MQRKTTLLLAAATLLVIAAGVSVWLVWFPPRAEPLEKRLLGAWDGTGEVSAESSFDMKPSPEQGIAGAKWSGTLTTACTVQAEFRQDGTYTWKEQHRAGDRNSKMSFEVALPRDGEQARWKVVRAEGDKLTIQTHLGDVVFAFQGRDAFTMTFPESMKSSGTVAFQRSGRPKN